jgi:hypothetical protein
MAELRQIGSRGWGKKGQEEMVGFVLIVVLVMVAAMIFLVISVRKGGDDMKESLQVENMLNTVLKYTTDCAIVFEPQYDSIEDLIKSCQEGEGCANLGDRRACDYLNESLKTITDDLIKSESGVVTAYEWNIVHKTSVGESDDASEREGDELLSVFGGNCTGTVSGALRLINLRDSGDLAVRLRVCKGS